MMTYENAHGSASLPGLTAEARTCPGCKGASATRDPDAHDCLRCTACGRRWRPTAPAPIEARPEPTPSDAVTATGADLLAAGLEAGLVVRKGGHHYHGEAYLGHGERGAVEALDGSPDLAAALAAELDAIAMDAAAPDDDGEG